VLVASFVALVLRAATLRLLLLLVASATAQRTASKIPLGVAAQSGDLELVHELLRDNGDEHNRKLNEQDMHGASALMKAS